MVTGSLPDQGLEHSNSQITLPGSSHVKEDTPAHELHSFQLRDQKKISQMPKFISPLPERKFQKM